MKLTTLQAYIEDKQKEFEAHQEEYAARNGGRRSSISFEEETLIWVIQDWYGMTGQFTEEEYQYLQDKWDMTPDEVNYFCFHGDDEED